LLSGIENLDWYANRLDQIADSLDLYHHKLTDEEDVKAKVISLFQNE
jgi:hypothetical protein